MGLDMYLYKADKDGNYDWKNDEVAYWRKANHIHNWFVQNVQDGIDECQDSVVSKGKVEELLSVCNEVLMSINLVDGEVNNGYTFKNREMTPIVEKGKIIEDPTVAKKLLPTRSGFFFGGTDYDEYYVDDIERTVNTLYEILESFDFENNTLIYTSSW